MENYGGHCFYKICHDIIECLVGALEAKDSYTCGHSSRVADMSYKLAKHMGIVGKYLEKIHISAHLHDIGKIGVPDMILNKHGKLLPDECRYIQEHPVIGYNILIRSKDLKDMAKIVLYHHERWDGSGYPWGLKGSDIPLGSRIIAICDAIDAMTSNRPYRKALSWNECRIEIIKNKGIQFDPTIVKSMESFWGELSLEHA